MTASLTAMFLRRQALSSACVMRRSATAASAKRGPWPAQNTWKARALPSRSTTGMAWVCFRLNCSAAATARGKAAVPLTTLTASRGSACARAAGTAAGRSEAARSGPTRNGRASRESFGMVPS